MKTTLDLPDDLMRAIKIRAVKENRKLEDAMADLLRRGLSRKPAASTQIRKRVKLPLVRCAHGARSGEEISHERRRDPSRRRSRATRWYCAIATFGWLGHFPSTFITKFRAHG